MDSESREFVWDQESTLFETTRAIAVYENPAGDIVIRQEANCYVDASDPMVIVPRERLTLLIERLRLLASLPE